MTGPHDTCWAFWAGRWRPGRVGPPRPDGTLEVSLGVGRPTILRPAEELRPRDPVAMGSDKPDEK